MALETETVQPDDRPTHLARRISERIAASPDGVIRSFSETGQHRSETYGSLWNRARDIAAALRDAGAKPSCVVIILTENVVDYVPAFWACLRGGFTAVALAHAAREFLFRDASAFADLVASVSNRFFVLDEAFARSAKLSALIGDCVLHLSGVTAATHWTDVEDANDPACLVATSGSTGTPKLAALSHAAVIFRNFTRTNDFDLENWHALGTFPLDGITGQQVVYVHFSSWTQISAETIVRRPAVVLDAIERFQANVLSLTNSMVSTIVETEKERPQARRLGCVKLIGLGAEPISAKTMNAFADLLARSGAPDGALKAGYGTTETGALVSGSGKSIGSYDEHGVCLGGPAPGVQMRIVDDPGRIVAEGIVGNLEVFCPRKMFSGYWRDSDSTKNGYTDDRWWKTGDLGRIFEGELYLSGRAKELLIRNGRKFALAEIDAELSDCIGAGEAYSCIISVDERETLAVAYCVEQTAPASLAEQRIKDRLARRFGLQPARLVRIEAGQLPKTANGKIRRHKLGDLIQEEPDRPTEPVEDGHLNRFGQIERKTLAEIWNTVLGRSGPVRPNDDFFAFGGDSLRSVSMHLQILDTFRVDIPSDEFFSDPTFMRLGQLVQRATKQINNELDRSDIAWPLPTKLNVALIAALETWPGVRPTRARTMLSFNGGGSRPPIFWVFNEVGEATQLAASVGPDQPVYAFRSGIGISDYREDHIQAFALRYLSDIVEVCPDGPFFVAGNCQGAIIALAIAQHAIRRQRHVPLLVLMDWAFALQPYAGHVLLVSGEQNFTQNARLHFVRPELAWDRAFSSHEFVTIPGGYAQGFRDGAVSALSAILTDRLRSSFLRRMPILPASAYRATVTSDNVPHVIDPREFAAISVVVSNVSNTPWRPSHQSGIMLSSRWIGSDGKALPHVSTRTALPELLPHCSATVELAVQAPAAAGRYLLNLELCEEGSRWFAPPAGGFCSQVTVPGRLSVARMLKFMRSRSK